MKAGVVVAAIAAAAGVAQAEPTFFVFQNEVAHRFTGNGPIDTFSLSDRLMGSALAPDGVIRGTSAIRKQNAGWEAYSVNDPMGTPSLLEISDTNSGPFSSVSYVGDTAYSFDSAGDLLTLDFSTLAQTGTVGNIGLGSGNVGSGYDASSDTMYIINKDTDSLYTLNYNTATPTLVGGLGFDWFNAGAEFFDGKLYAAIQIVSSGELVLGEVNTSTGAFSAIRTVATFDPNGTPMQVSLAIVPAPAGLGLLGAAGLVAMRRRGLSNAISRINRRGRPEHRAAAFLFPRSVYPFALRTRGSRCASTRPRPHARRSSALPASRLDGDHRRTAWATACGTARPPRRSPRS
ncbi:MAG: hypothetical protein ACF8R9_04755 [Phycisphaerales bacterium JB054]